MSASATSAAATAPARFAPRLGALSLDLLLAVVALQLIAPPAYQASGGRAQLLNAPFGVWRCETQGAAASEMARAVGPRICVRSLLGHPFASAASGGAGAGAERRWEGPIDAQGRPVAPLDLGWLLAPLFALVRLWFEAFGTRSPGRALFQQRLIGADAGAVGAGALSRRYAALIGPFLLAAWCAGAAIRVAPSLAAGATGLATLALALVYGGAALAVLRGRAPFHDRAAGTRVVAEGASA